MKTYQIYEDSDVQDFSQSAVKDRPTFGKKFWKGFRIAFLISMPFWIAFGIGLYFLINSL